MARKLFDIQDDGVTKILTRFITEGKQAKLGEKPTKGGFTVWKMKSGSPTAIHHSTIEAAAKECLKV